MKLQTKMRIGKLLGSIALLALSIVMLWVSVQLAGILATILYAILFLFGLMGVPTYILLKGTDVMGGTLLGKLHFLLGQFAFGTGVLLQRGDTHDMIPGRKTSDGYEAWYDGEWVEVADGHNVSILGLHPFIYAADKDSRAFNDIKLSSQNRKGARSDGGNAITRAGVAEVAPPADIDEDDAFVVDLKRLFNSGLRKMGNIALIEKAEEIEQRNQTKDSLSDRYSTVIGSIVGLLIGVISGYIMLGGV